MTDFFFTYIYNKSFAFMRLYGSIPVVQRLLNICTILHTVICAWAIRIILKTEGRLDTWITQWRDVRSSDMAAAWAPVIWTSIILYLPVTFLLQRWMQSRKPFQLKWMSVIWNIGLALASTLGVIFMLPDYKALSQFYYAEHDYAPPTRAAIAIFCLTKPVEFGDTFLLVLKKRPLRFLHVYHHITVAMYCWHALRTCASFGHLLAYTNLVIHAFMYCYFAMATLFPKQRILRAIRPYITMAQTLQMFFGMWIAWTASFTRTYPLVHNSGLFKPVYASPKTVIFNILTPGNPTKGLSRLLTETEWGNAICALCMYASYAYLFILFFLETYVHDVRPMMLLPVVIVHGGAIAGAVFAWSHPHRLRILCELFAGYVITAVAMKGCYGKKEHYTPDGRIATNLVKRLLFGKRRKNTKAFSRRTTPLAPSILDCALLIKRNQERPSTHNALFSTTLQDGYPSVPAESSISNINTPLATTYSGQESVELSTTDMASANQSLTFDLFHDSKSDCSPISKVSKPSKIYNHSAATTDSNILSTAPNSPLSDAERSTIAQQELSTPYCSLNKKELSPESKTTTSITELQKQSSPSHLTHQNMWQLILAVQNVWVPKALEEAEVIPTANPYESTKPLCMKEPSFTSSGSNIKKTALVGSEYEIPIISSPAIGQCARLVSVSAETDNQQKQNSPSWNSEINVCTEAHTSSPSPIDSPQDSGPGKQIESIIYDVPPVPHNRTHSFAASRGERQPSANPPLLHDISGAVTIKPSSAPSLPTKIERHELVLVTASLMVPALYGFFAHGNVLLGFLVHGCLRWMIELYTTGSLVTSLSAENTSLTPHTHQRCSDTRRMSDPLLDEHSTSETTGKIQTSGGRQHSTGFSAVSAPCPRPVIKKTAFHHCCTRLCPVRS